MGVEGIGKTGFALQFPKPVKVLSINEAGFEDLDLIDEVPEGCSNVRIKDWRHFKEEIDDPSPATIVVDSSSGLQQILFDFIIRTKYDNNEEEFFSFYKGPRQVAPRYIEELCTTFENLRNLGKNVLVLSHTDNDLFRNPDGLDYTKVEINMDKGPREPLVNWSQSILYMCMDTGTERVTKSKGDKAVEGKMRQGDVRVIKCSKSMTYTSKNKLKLPPVIPMGDSAEDAFMNFFQKLPPKIQASLTS